jgi:hypothetical protein
MKFNPLRKMNAWQTTDGTIFTNLHKAERYEKRTHLKREIENLVSKDPELLEAEKDMIADYISNHTTDLYALIASYICTISIPLEEKEY